MNQGYEKFKCINKMTDENKQRFKEIVNDNIKVLDTTISENGSIYTEHDFSHHCCDLFHIISDLLLDDTAYSTELGIGLSSGELYLLNIAVVLHDIGMFERVEFDRKIHSHLSAEKIQEKYKNPKDCLSEGKSGLGRNQIKALKRIVKAHSDVKDGSVSEEENGLKDKKLTNEMPGKQGEKIRARFLADVLRLADELDITNDRLGDIELEVELEKAKQKKDEYERKLLDANDEQKKEIERQLKRYEEAIVSYEHLKRLYLFGNLERDQSGVVKLIVDDEYIEEMQSKGVGIEELAENISSIYHKIEKEFNDFMTDIKKDLRFQNMVAIKKIEILTRNVELDEYLKKKKEKDFRQKEEEQYIPQVLSEEIADKITKFVDKRNLVEVGHFKLHDNLCARDWIVTDEVIETQPFFKKCEAQFLLHLVNHMENNKDYLLVGIDFGGMLIASKLACATGKAYTYVIPANISSSDRETEFKPEKYENIVLVTDVIVTYDTIRGIIEKYNIADKVKYIYSVFFRDAEHRKYISENQDLVKITYVLNDEFDIEVHTNEECRYKDCASCKASNIRYS